jgi:16S rRNA processing protein RimM
MPDRDDKPDDATGEGDLVLLGRISGAHGIRGDVKITSFTAVPEDIAAYGPLTDGKGSNFTIERLRPLKGMGIAAQLRGIADRNAAEALKGVELYVARSKLPEPDEDEWYYSDLVGLAAVNGDGDTVGEVVAVQDFGAGDLLEIRQPGERHTLLLPFTRASVPVVDVKAGRVVIVPPEEMENDDGGETG